MLVAMEFVKKLFREQLQMGSQADLLTEDSVIVGVIPEFDSMAVVSMITAIEEQLGIEIADEEITAEIFGTVGTLAAFVTEKMNDK